jgi:chaperonin GroES
MNYNPADMQKKEDQPSPATNALQDPNTDKILQESNLAKGLSDDKLTAIAEFASQGYELDRSSREDWETDLEEWIKLANQIREPKSYPWPKASNIKYPMLSTAAMQFAARAYPSLVPSNGKIVNARVVGKDYDGQKLEKANRVSQFMSYQIMSEIPGWEEDMDKMLMMLPVVGTMFKKTWYDKSDDKIKSQLILPRNIVVNYWTKSLHECERISEVIEMSPRILKEKQNAGLFLNVELGDPVTPSEADPSGHTANDTTTPYTIIEQHTFYDLDNDDYPEPYIITFEESSKKILRIQARYNENGVVYADDRNKKIKKIIPLQMYTKFGFVPNPDGSFYDIGFGILLGPLNESVNTIINQLVDSGTLNNLQSGFIGKGLRLKMGENIFRPGEWKPVNATGDDLRKQIVPLPLKEPSTVLFQLMGTLITSGKELASVAEIFTGKMPGQNTPATTTMASVEQGMKVFTAVYKRIFRALSEEFDKLFNLNATYTDPHHIVEVLDMEIGPQDFDKSVCDIVPGADPTAMSQTEKLMKAQGLMEILQVAGPLMNPVKIISRVLDAQEQPSWQELFSDEVQQTGQVPPAPPDPKVMALQMKGQLDQQKAALASQAQQQKMELEGRSAEQKMAMEAQQHALDMQIAQDEHHLSAASQLAKNRLDIARTAAQGQQQLQQKEQQHQQTMQQTKEKQTLQSRTQNSKSGKNTR